MINFSRVIRITKELMPWGGGFKGFQNLSKTRQILQLTGFNKY
jgi:hypothetical protein